MQLINQYLVKTLILFMPNTWLSYIVILYVFISECLDFLIYHNTCVLLARVEDSKPSKYSFQSEDNSFNYVLHCENIEREREKTTHFMGQGSALMKAVSCITESELSPGILSWEGGRTDKATGQSRL